MNNATFFLKESKNPSSEYTSTMRKKALVFFSTFLRQNKQQANDQSNSEEVHKVNHNHKASGQMPRHSTKKSLAEMVFHNSAKRRLKQYRANLHK